MKIQDMLSTGVGALLVLKVGAQPFLVLKYVAPACEVAKACAPLIPMIEHVVPAQIQVAEKTAEFPQVQSNEGTGGMESSVVFFKPRIHLFACTHPSVSNWWDCNDWSAYKHQPTALCSTTAF